MSNEKPRLRIIKPGVNIYEFSAERLVALLLGTDEFKGAWRSRAEIIVGFMPPHPSENTAPKCVVRFGGSFLRHSAGPHQHHFWDMYGDDYLYPELALLALSQAEPPYWSIKP